MKVTKRRSVFAVWGERGVRPFALQTTLSVCHQRFALKLSSHHETGGLLSSSKADSEASECLPQESTVGEIVFLLRVDERQEYRCFCIPLNLLQLAHGGHHVHGRAALAKSTILLRRPSLGLAVGTDSLGNDFKNRERLMIYRRGFRTVIFFFPAKL